MEFDPGVDYRLRLDAGPDEVRVTIESESTPIWDDYKHLWDIPKGAGPRVIQGINDGQINVELHRIVSGVGLWEEMECPEDEDCDCGVIESGIMACKDVIEAWIAEVSQKSGSASIKKEMASLPPQTAER